jgi:hypothetical protein
MVPTMPAAGWFRRRHASRKIAVSQKIGQADAIRFGCQTSNSHSIRRLRVDRRTRLRILLIIGKRTLWRLNGMLTLDSDSA